MFFVNDEVRCPECEDAEVQADYYDFSSEDRETVECEIICSCNACEEIFSVFVEGKICLNEFFIKG